MAQNAPTQRIYILAAAIVAVAIIAGIALFSGGGTPPSTAEQPSTSTPGATSPAPTTPAPDSTTPGTTTPGTTK